MIRGKKTLTVMVSLLLVLGLALIAMAKYEPPKTIMGTSPAAAPDPNWELKEAMQGEHEDGYVPQAVGEEFVPPEPLASELFRAAAGNLSNVTLMEAGPPPVLRDCPVVCPPGGFSDGENCGDDTNGGCNMTTPGFTDVACGDTVCGTIWADGGTRDTDWYRLFLDGPTLVTWYCQAEFDCVIGFVDTSDCALASQLDPYATFPQCGEGSVSRIAGPGEYWLFVSHQTYYDWPCDSNNDFWAAVSCTPIDEGVCCDPATGDCAEPPMDQATCEAMWGGTGVWKPGVLSCTPNPCPPPAGPGDNCDNPLVVNIPGDLPYESKNNYTCGRQDDYSAANMCYTYGYGDGEDGTYELVVTADANLDFTMDPKGTTWTYFEIRTACVPPNGSCVGYARNTGGTSYQLQAVYLAAGTYYVHVDTWPSPDCIPDYDLTIEAAPMPNEGDNCANPLSYTIGSADLPYTIANQYTCGRSNHYSSTCLGSYDGGEDIMIEIIPTESMSVDVTLDPKGTTWTGIAIDDACPPGSPCLGYVTSSSGSPKTIYSVFLTAGVSYYIMADTWPSPACIPDLDVIISAGAPPPPNDNCADAEAVGDVVDLPFSTMTASFDGGGTCMYSANIWYCYTATCTGEATFSLCGSGFDTKLAVYDGCACDPLGAELGCNDDACGLQSELSLMVTAGNEYLVEVGGYSSNTGDGILNISCEEAQPPPYNDECTGATVNTCPVTITGDNSWSTNEIPWCLGDCGHAWEAFTIDECMDVTIDFCGTTPSFELVYIILYKDDCPVTVCDPIYYDATDWGLCGDGNVTIYFFGLQPGTYYYPVLACHPSYPTYYYEGPYTININCEPCSYCPAWGGCDEYISNVTFESINNNTGCDGYGDYTALTATVQPGGTYPFSMTIGNAYSLDAGAVWIDFDQSLTFDAGELCFTGSGYGPYVGNITIPAGATLGPTRMRVRLVWNLTPEPCGGTTYGEVEDYTVNIICEPDDNEVGIGTDPIWMYYAFAIDTHDVEIYIAPDNVGGPPAGDIDLTSIMINGHPAISSTLGGPVLDFSCGPTVTSILRLPIFLSPYGAPIGENIATYNVTGNLLPSGSFVYSGTVTLFGKDPTDPSKWMVPEGEIVLRADCDRSGFVNISDAIFLLNFIFAGGEPPLPQLVADCDCNAMVNVSDVVYLVTYIFGGGNAPCPAPN